MTSLSPFNSILELFAGFNAALFGFVELRKYGHNQSSYDSKKQYKERIKRFNLVKDKINNFRSGKTDLKKEISDFKFERLLNRYFECEIKYSFSYFGIDSRIKYIEDSRRLISLFYYGFFYCLVILLINGFSDTYPEKIEDYRSRMSMFNIFSLFFIFIVSFHSKKLTVFENIAIITGTIAGQTGLFFLTGNNKLFYPTLTQKFAFFEKLLSINKSIAASNFLIIEVLIISFIPIFVCYFYPIINFSIKNLYNYILFQKVENKILNYI